MCCFFKAQRFSGAKNLDNLINFALSFASGNVFNVDNLEKYGNLKANKPWLLVYCLSNNPDSEEELNHELNCLEEMSLRKLAIMLNNLVNVANIDCASHSSIDLCSKLKPNLSKPILFYSSLPNLETNQPEPIPVSYAEHNKIYQQILTFLPDNTELNENELKVKI